MSGLDRDDIIRMAREAGEAEGLETVIFHPVLERFAALVAAAEREACAKVCEQPIDEIQITDDCSETMYKDYRDCAAAIRARGNDAA